MWAAKDSACIWRAWSRYCWSTTAAITGTSSPAEPTPWDRPMKPAGRVAIVTGAGGSIGTAGREYDEFLGGTVEAIPLRRSAGRRRSPRAWAFALPGEGC
jgi:hypothetical protein